MNNPTATKKNIIIIELSEFSVDLLTQAVNLYPLSNLKKVLQFKKSSYKTNDRYNGGYLTPYSQWTSIHSGVSAKTHRIITADGSENPNLKYFWQVLDGHHITTKQWGIEPYIPTPSRIPPFFQHVKTVITFLKTAFKLGCAYQIFKEIFKFRLKIKNNINLLSRYITWLDYMSTLLFCKMKQNHNPQCSILFIGSLAYCQTYHWNGDDQTLSAELVYNLQTLDKILGRLFTTFKNDTIIIHNALSQIKTKYEQRLPVSGKTIHYTGRYIPLGTIYSQDLNFPNHIFNHEFNQYIYHYFLPEYYKLKSEYIEDEAALDTSSSAI